MQTFGDRVVDKAKALVADEIGRISEIVIGPGLIEPLNYRYMVGQIHGLRVADEIIGKAVSEIQQEARAQDAPRPTLAGDAA